MVQERADERRVEVIDVELKWLFAGLVVGEREKQPEGVAVGGDRLGARRCAG